MNIILVNFSILQAYNSATDDYINKSIFKDKKLNYLWSKAENSGFTHEELVALREEFSHHQEKIDQYYDLFDDNSGKEDAYRSKYFSSKHYCNLMTA